ncbi:TIGR03560 family F420-dependent LLM class oxidoreductase [Saccharomonospora halophila]|uniref:TIGR03560 family F420-dependent LLM class oxidoreductase n=1 Tax=Saccharomonospora halophila TaxID=129922 RepID=UPI0003665174|nr:TIGR03560 family F420-dependent LLM class oxidoreductase [Saccharomonospora halophila]
MRISVSVTNYSWRDGPPERRLAEVARAADHAGLDTLWVPDHLLQVDPTSTGDAEMLEAYTTLGFLAARTRRIRLGTLVTAVTFRPAALLIKAVTTLDVLSGGRARLGLGAGYHEGEARAMGLSLPPIAERFARLEETLRLAEHLWSGHETAFHGTRHHLENPVNRPFPVSRPRPPVLIGGTGEQRTLRLVARYADACNLYDLPDDGRTVRRKVAVLARHCEELGRSIDTVDKTLTTRLSAGENTDDFVRRCALAGEWGIDHVVVLTSGPWTEQGMATLTRAADELGGKR